MILGIGKRSWAERRRQVGKVAALAGVVVPATLSKTALPQIMRMKAGRLIGKM